MTGTDSQDSHPRGVSVVIPHYGDPALANQVVDDLQTQVGAGPIQVIVADDCSPEPFPTRDGVATVRHGVNRGFGAAVNTGASVATHPWLLIVNSDVRLEDDSVRRLVEAGEMVRPAVCSPLLVESGRPTSTANKDLAAFRTWAGLQPLARFAERRWMRRLVGFDDACTPGTRRRTDWLVGACLLLPTETFRAVGGFDERFHMFCEEVDLQRRLAEQGVPAWFLGDVAVHHVGGGTTGWTGRAGRLADSQMLYARTWGFHRRLLATGSAVALSNLGYNLARRAAGRPVQPWRTFRVETSHLRHALAHSRRAATRPARRSPDAT